MGTAGGGGGDEGGGFGEVVCGGERLGKVRLGEGRGGDMGGGEGGKGRTFGCNWMSAILYFGAILWQIQDFLQSIEISLT